MMNRVSGLSEWLEHQGVTIGETLVLDPQNSAFPVPVTREVGGFRFQEVRMLDYPFFVDAREPGLNPVHPITAGIPQITMAWASPIDVEPEKNAGRQVDVLIQSSADAWTDESMDVLPRVTDTGISGWTPNGDTAPQALGVALSGQFNSWFAGRPSPLLPGGEEEAVA
jgi:ABC-2 type transport system permease protein